VNRKMISRAQVLIDGSAVTNCYTHNILSLFRLGATIYTILSFHSFTTCFGPTWPSSGYDYFARRSHCHTL
jgi:hypothetical protein